MEISDIDPTLNDYSKKLQEKVSEESGSKVLVKHEFLDVHDETLWEAQALFHLDTENINNIKYILGQFHWSQKPDGLVIVASIGTSSTQVYSQDKLIGYLETGTTAMKAHPSLAKETLSQIISVGQRKCKGILVPIVLINSISFFVKESVNLLDRGATLGAVSTEDKDQQNFSNVLNEMCDAVEAMKLCAPCILWSKKGESPRKIDSSWISFKCCQLCRQYPHGVYIADFGGGGPDLQYFDGNPKGVCTGVNTKRCLVDKQNDFVADMISRKYDSNAFFNDLVRFFAHEISKHAKENKILPQDAGKFVCLIFQTGMCRQQHYKGTFEPSTEITVFEDDDIQTPLLDPKQLLGPRFDRRLEGYRQHLQKAVGPKIDLIHEFLHVRDETLWEQQALFRSSRNIKVLKRLLLQFSTGESETECIAGSTMEESKQEEHIAVTVCDNDDEGSIDMDAATDIKSEIVNGGPVDETDELAIIASVATSSTQVYTRNTLIGNFQTGTSAMEANPSLAGSALEQIVEEARRKKIFSPIILINSISFYVTRSVNLNAKKRGAWVGALATDDDANITDSQFKILVELENAAKKLSLERPVILWSKTEEQGESPIEYRWIDVKYQQLRSLYPHGLYVVEFGGGGPDVQFVIDGRSKRLGKFGRSFRRYQENFIADMITRNFQSDTFKKIVAFIRGTIEAHATSCGVPANETGRYVCRLYQTGMCRQQHFLGHCRPIPKIMNFDEDDINEEIDVIDEHGVQPSALNDNAHGIDRFGYTAYAKALVKMLEPCSPPVCVGIFAQWGAGKTFMFFLLKKCFDHTVREDRRTNALTQWFEESYDTLTPSLDEDSPELHPDTIWGRWTTRWVIISGLFSALLGSITPTSYAWLTIVALCSEVFEQVQSNAERCFSSLLQFMRGRLNRGTKKRDDSEDTEPDVENVPLKEYIFVDFNAWKYNKSDELWAGLISEMYKKVELRFASQVNCERGPAVDFKSQWRVQKAVQLLVDTYGGWNGVQLRLIGLFLVSATVPVGAWLVVRYMSVFKGALAALAVVTAPLMPVLHFLYKSANYANTSRGDDIFTKADGNQVQDKIGFMTEVINEVNQLFNFMIQFEEKTNIKLVIVVFVDDLDRCNDRALKVLEAIQLILSVPGSPVIVFLAIDARVVASSIDTALNKNKGPDDFRVSGQEYLDKFIQIPFTLPDPSRSKVKHFLSCADQGDGDVTPEHVLRRVRKLYEWAVDHYTEKKLLRFREEYMEIVRYRPVNLLPPAEIVERLSALFPSSQSSFLPSSMKRISLEADVALNSLTVLESVRYIARSLTESTFRAFEYSQQLTRDEAVEFLCQRITFVLRGIQINESRSEVHEKDSYTRRERPWMPSKLNDKEMLIVNDRHTTLKCKPTTVEKSPFWMSIRPAAIRPESPSKSYLHSLQTPEKKMIKIDFQRSVLEIKDRSRMQPALLNVVHDFGCRLDPNPRKLKRIVNVLQLIFEVAKTKAVSEEDSQHMICQLPGWKKFAAKLVKWISLCECYPFRMALMSQIAQDFDQKQGLDEITTKRSGCLGGDITFQYRKLVHDGKDVMAKSVEDVLVEDMYAARFFYEHAEPYLYVLRNAHKLKLLDGDPENFAILLHTPVQFESKEVDITIEDLLGPKVATGGRDDNLSLLSYSFNLSDSVRHQIGHDLHEYMSEWEMYAKGIDGKVAQSLRPKAFVSKDKYLVDDNPFMDEPKQSSGDQLQLRSRFMLSRKDKAALATKDGDSESQLDLYQDLDDNAY